MPRRIVSLVAPLLLLVTACDDDSPTRPPATPRVVPRIVVSATKVVVGDTIRYWVKDSTSGDTLDLPGTAFEFSSTRALWPYMWEGRLVATDPGPMRMIARLPNGSADTVDLEVTQFYRDVVVAGGRHSCALSQHGRPYCWGESAEAAYGSSGEDVLVPRWASMVRDSSPQFVSLAATSAHTCGVAVGDRAYCWGANPQGQVGRAAADAVLTPLEVFPVPALRQVVTGTTHSCALATSGESYCWGNGASSGATGDFSSGDALVRAAHPGTTFVMLGSGSDTQCALDARGQAWCWGRNAALQLGRATPSGSPTAPDTIARPASTSLSFVTLASGTDMTCGATSTGRAVCWGAGHLGDGAFTASGDSVPHAVDIPTSSFVVQIAVEGRYACALDNTGRAWCWGENPAAGMGDGTATSQIATRPVAVGGDLRFHGIDVSPTHACAAATDGYLYCWGDNAHGQLGTGDRQARLTPTRVGYQR